MKNWKTSAESILTTGPVVPVIVVKKLEHAVPMAKALVAGGVRVLEVTLRTECAVDAIRAIAKEVPEAIVGAGTVLNPQQLAEVTEAGAQFAISPGLTEPLLKAATEGTIPLIPGISTVSELMLGMDYGLKEFKFFPAEANGGVKALQAIAGPFSQVRFCPTGGISPANYRDYLALKSVLCIGGSWLVPADALEAGDYDRITKLAREAVGRVVRPLDGRPAYKEAVPHKQHDNRNEGEVYQGEPSTTWTCCTRKRCVGRLQAVYLRQCHAIPPRFPSRSGLRSWC